MCSGQILILVKIVIRIPPHQKHLKRTTNLTYQLDHCWSKEKALDLAPSPRSPRGPSLTSATIRSLSDPRSLSDIRNYQVPLRPNTPLRHSKLSGPFLATSIRDCSPDIQLGWNRLTNRKLRPPHQRPSKETPDSTLDATQ